MRRTLIAGASIAAVLVALALATSAGANHSVTTWLSTGPTGGNGPKDSNVEGYADDGTRVFFSTDEQMVAADTDAVVDVYERNGSTTTLISTGSAGGNGAFDAQFFDASKDGARVFFETDESLVAGDTDAKRDVYERSGGTTTLVSTGPTGGNGAQDAFFAAISQDGLHVFFHTYESLVAGDSDSNRKDIYERYAGTTTQVSVGQINGNGLYEAVYQGSTPDGSIVWFESDEQLASTDTDSYRDVYQRSGGTTSQVSQGVTGGNGAFVPRWVGASQNGSKVFFETTEALTSGDTDGTYYDIYQRESGATTLISTSPTGGAGAYDATFGGSSLDGTRVFFETREALVASDTDGSCLDDNNNPVLLCIDVYERTNGSTTTQFSVGQINGNGSYNAAFSAVSQEGGRVFFESDEALTTGDTDPGGIDVYERSFSTTTLVSTGPAVQQGAYSADLLGISTDGSRVFVGTYEQLTTGDTDGNWLDVYERYLGATTLISTGPATVNAAALALWRGASFDGTRVFFQTDEVLVSSDTDSYNDVYQTTAPISGYPRPKGATPARVALVPAYQQCTAPNRTHGPALAYGSCLTSGMASQESAVLTVGSPDVTNNNKTASSTSSIRYKVVVGAPGPPEDSDLQFLISVNDVRCKTTTAVAGSCAGTETPVPDFTGKLLLRAQAKLTDKYNGSPATESATVQEFNLDVPVQCVATASTTEGGLCSLNTSLNALFPGAVLDTKRSIYELGTVKALDPGPNGTGYGAGCPSTCGDGDETVFMRQGIFVP